MKRRVTLLVAVLGVLAGADARAQGRCRDAETIGACWQRLTATDTAGVNATGRSAITRQRERVAARATESGGATGVPGSIADFLPLFAGSIGTAANGLAARQSFETTVRIQLDPAHPPGQAFRVRGTRHVPELFAGLADSLTARGAAARIGEVERGLAATDDYEIELSWNVEGGGLGRSYAAHADFASTILSAVVRNAEESRGDAMAADLRFSRALARAAANRLAAPECSSPDGETLRFNCLNEAVKDEVNTALSAAAAALVDVEAAVRRDLAAAQFHRIADLVNNQPQLSFSAAARQRAALVGPDGWSFQMRYERGFANMNTLRAWCGRQNIALDQTCLTQYLALPGVLTALRRGDRMWFSLTMDRTAAYAMALPSDTVAVTLPATTSVEAGGGFGRYLYGPSAELETGRIDAALRYVRREKGDARRSRLTASATYTQRVADGVQMVGVAEYSDVPDPLANRPDRLTVTFGLRYALARAEP